MAETTGTPGDGGAVAVNGSAARPKPPDRATFERRLSQVNARLSELNAGRRRILGDTPATGSTPSPAQSTHLGELTECRRQMTDIRTRRYAHRAAWTSLVHVIDEYKTKIDEQVKIMCDCEHGNDLMYKDETRLESKIAQLTNIHRTAQFDTLREENLFVKEIDKLNRNKKKLPTYLEAQARRKELDDELRKVEYEASQTKRLERRCQYDERKQYDIRSRITKELATIKKDHQPAVERKRQLIDEYERERRAFIDWQREHHLPVAAKSLSMSSAASSGRKHAMTAYRTPLNSTKSSAGGDASDSSDSDSESAQLEPFHEQRRVCRWAIGYLTQLQAQLEDGGGASRLVAPPTMTYAQVARRPINYAASSGDEKAADSATSSLEHPNLSVQRVASTPVNESLEVSAASLNVDSPNRQKKKSSKKSSKKPSQPVTHPSQAYQAFGTIDLEPPATYGDILLTLAGVQRRLNEIDERTQVPVEMSHGDWEALYTPATDTAATGSTHTPSISDSVTFSDASFTSSITSPTSPGTPDQHHPLRLPTSVSGTSLPRASSSHSSSQTRLSGGGGSGLVAPGQRRSIGVTSMDNDDNSTTHKADIAALIRQLNEQSVLSTLQPVPDSPDEGMEMDKMSSVGSGSVGGAQRQSSGISMSAPFDTNESTGTIKGDPIDLMHFYDGTMTLNPTDDGEAIQMKIDD